jgi:hypothetical protein
MSDFPCDSVYHAVSLLRHRPLASVQSAALAISISDILLAAVQVSPAHVLTLGPQCSTDRGEHRHAAGAGGQVNVSNGAKPSKPRPAL